ncbi:MAG: hypothetical protein HN336_05330 [Lentimicrobiaceae bacterium]|jgi:hypothetical protein|nr:hypothetical protein [Lentimicrobiaceae bacterium]MCP4911290.1 hypothetical protein [Bacteroidota bacterium]MBT3454021.1 hypothetical protein [Lentimicrobiaceae bacterium]MBT3819139.1 hypothetical protein [Lentimicrobiaceae bacterium]MBT4060567.1 hypothetical protein [Lentimicrobiaceae bacterium]
MIIKYLYPMLIAIFTLSISSCTDDDLMEEDDYIQQYVGTWSVNDQPARINYDVTIIAKPSNSSEIIMTNFANLGTSASALVIGNSLVIELQDLGSEYTVSGSGIYVNSKKLEFSFELINGIESESRTALFSR